MLKTLRIQNFKAWQDTGTVRLAPLTVIFGANSAGKSSLGHLLLALKQTALSSDRKRALHLGDKTSLIDLGTFTDCLNGHDLSKSLNFQITWSLPKQMEIKDPLNIETRYVGHQIYLGVGLAAASKSSQPEITSIKYKLTTDTSAVMNIDLTRGSDRIFSLQSNEYQFKLEVGRKWPIEEPEKFYRLSDLSIARYKNAGFLTDFALATESMLSSITYLGPLRKHPERTYQWSGDTPESVGQNGEATVAAILAAQHDGRQLNRGPGQKIQAFSPFIAKWLKDLGVIHSFTIKPVADGRKEFEVLVETHQGAPVVKITDVGFGVSQVLPAIVQAFYCPPNSTVWMEQPEIHLHPQVQSELADVFISAIKARQNGKARNVQLIVESHSEHFLNRLQRRIAEGVLTTDEVAIYFCRRTNSGTELESLRLNLFGEIENWPDNFFGDEMEDITQRTLAAMGTKMKQSQTEAS
jgi:predicted ATPase